MEINKLKKLIINFPLVKKLIIIFKFHCVEKKIIINFKFHLLTTYYFFNYKSDFNFLFISKYISKNVYIPNVNLIFLIIYLIFSSKIINYISNSSLNKQKYSYLLKILF